MKITKYESEFPKRTVQLIQSFKKREVDFTLDVTFLMNCMLGLIVTAVENSKRSGLLTGKVDAGLIHVFPEKVEIIKQKTINRVPKKKLTEVVKTELHSWEKIRLLSKIRNGIAHQNIKPVNEAGKWKGVILWNVTPADLTDFRMKLTIDELYNLASFICQHYLLKSRKATIKNGY